MSKNIRLFGLIKILKKEYLDDFLKGDLYMNDISFYRNDCDDLDEMFDNSEGTFTLNSKEGYKVLYGKELLGVCSDVSLSLSGGIKVFCMFGLYGKEVSVSQGTTSEELTRKFLYSDNMRTFGDAVCFIHDVKTFLDRVNNSAKQLDLQVDGGPLVYRDIEKFPIRSNEVGRVKPSRFSHQAEYRLRIRDSKKEEHVILPIGDIRDIVILDTFEGFRSKIKIGFEEV
ncbi:MAG: hypothetical protein CME63_04315 [Halobacteriovoraceae bacterium]|jgi:hypothetical protein|nr:hypothetical protein [Halobacteriovoraceae bacterium]|tara:strand:- start:245893 stop:246573 length:681 start_codon:yes stop_codon:yes gene_type:complete